MGRCKPQALTDLIDICVGIVSNAFKPCSIVCSSINVTEQAIKIISVIVMKCSAHLIVHSQLPESLLQFQLFQEFVAAAKEFPASKDADYEREVVIARFQQVTNKLPDANRKTASILMHHLKRYVSCSYQSIQLSLFDMDSTGFNHVIPLYGFVFINHPSWQRVLSQKPQSWVYREEIVLLQELSQFNGVVPMSYFSQLSSYADSRLASSPILWYSFQFFRFSGCKNSEQCNFWTFEGKKKIGKNASKFYSYFDTHHI